MKNNFSKQNFYKQIAEFDNNWFIFKNCKRSSCRKSFPWKNKPRFIRIAPFLKIWYEAMWKKTLENKILEQSTSNRKTWARIPAQSKASFFPQKDFQFFNSFYYLSLKKCLAHFNNLIQNNNILFFLLDYCNFYPNLINNSSFFSLEHSPEFSSLNYVKKNSLYICKINIFF